MENQTNKYNELFAALAKAQAEFDIVGKNRSSHYGGYADLEELIAATRPALTKYGLSILMKYLPKLKYECLPMLEVTGFF